ncbi:MAG TPA: DUF2336 domain-containing protein, partial [Arenibaculum sp.]|nr:DUF2336 domain-containing protein [Arenibaculum sp.]
MSKRPSRSDTGPTIDYDTSKRLAQDADPRQRLRVAGSPEVEPELLYFLALDDDVEVRRTVAGNPAAPMQASQVLVRDRDESVRRMLAAKLARALPDLNRDEHDRLFRHTVLMLEGLACDQALSVRAALASSLKDVACAPPAVCRTLAHDAAREVAEPMLHYCAALPDEDLLALIASESRSWALDAVARRPSVSEPVSDAIYATGRETAIIGLIENPGAAVSEPTLARMVEDSRQRTAWQLPLARRPRLPPGLALRLAGFVDEHVIEVLRRHPDLDPPTVAEVAEVTRRRLEFLRSQPSGQPAEQHVRRLHAEGRLDEDAIGDALSWQDLDFVRLALALKAGLPLSVVA